MTKLYKIAECFYSLQGEGARSGEANVFLRFAGCNINCREDKHGFTCDTNHQAGSYYTLDEVIRMVQLVRGKCNWIVLTGGEPLLQVDDSLLAALIAKEFSIALETNGTHRFSKGAFDWICVSPKKGELLEATEADEVRVVLSEGDNIPDVKIKATHYYLSPAYRFCDEGMPINNLNWCIKLCLENPMWKLSLQNHKVWNIR